MKRWEVVETEYKDRPKQWDQVKGPTITIAENEEDIYSVLLPEAFLEEFYNKAPKEIGITTERGHRSFRAIRGHQLFDKFAPGPEAMDKLRKELAAALDWLLEQECLSEGASCEAANNQQEKGEETMSTTKEQKEIKAPEIQWSGRNITLPALPQHMAPRDAARVLLDKAKEEEQEVAVMEEIADCFPWDGAVQFSRAMAQLHGWGRAVSKDMGFFGKRPPVSIAVQTGPDTHEEVIWGPFRIPGMSEEGELECGTSTKDGRIIFCIRGTVKKKDLPLVRSLADLTRHLAQTSSIYRGKAIQLIVQDDGKVNWMEQPRFPNPSVRMEHLIYDDFTLDQIGTHLIAPITKRETLEKLGRPFGGAVLVCGPYGTGKTVLAGALANLCRESNTTFIFVTSLKAVCEVLVAARPLGPTVVFVEDIDRISQDGERNEETQQIMNMLASITSRDAQVMAVFTTNKPGAIHPGLVQRFSGLLSIDPPKAPEIAKLIRLYGRDLIDPNEDLTEAADYLNGTVPRTIEQLVQASKAYAVHRNGVNDITDIRIIGRDIIGAAKHKEVQLRLSQREVDRVLSPEERIGQALAEVVAKQLPLKLIESIAKTVGAE